MTVLVCSWRSAPCKWSCSLCASYSLQMPTVSMTGRLLLDGFYSIRFSSKWYLDIWKGPDVLHPICWFPQHCLEAVPMFIWLVHSHPFKEDCQALPPQLQVVSRAPWNLWFSEMQATTCNGCFAHQSVCSVISLDSSFSRAAPSTGVSKSGFQNGDTCQSGLPIALFVPSS